MQLLHFTIVALNFNNVLSLNQKTDFFKALTFNVL